MEGKRGSGVEQGQMSWEVKVGKVCQGYKGRLQREGTWGWDMDMGRKRGEGRGEGRGTWGGTWEGMYGWEGHKVPRTKFKEI